MYKDPPIEPRRFASQACEFRMLTYRILACTERAAKNCARGPLRMRKRRRFQLHTLKEGEMHETDLRQLCHLSLHATTVNIRTQNIIINISIMYSSWLLGGPVFGQPPRKKQKKSKPKATSWFEKVTVEELKQLCKASLLPVSGTKAALIERLSTADRTSRFTYEYAAPRYSMSDFENSGYGSYDDMKPKAEKKYSGARRPDGMSTEQLKSECRSKGLVV
jgi:hypothetical protein